MNYSHHPRPLRGHRRMALRAGVACWLLLSAATGMKAQAPDAPRAASLGTGATALKGLDQLAGQTLATLQAKACATNSDKVSSYSYDDRTKVFFIYNVATGKYLNMGGYWGMHASLKDYPLPVFTRTFSADTQAVGFDVELSTKQANQIRWVNAGDGKPSEDQGVYCDRGSSISTSVDGYMGWLMEPVSGDGDKNTYRLYTYSGSSTGTAKLYLCANISDAASGGTTLSDDQNCDAFTEAEMKEKGLTDEDSHWRVFSLDQLYDLLGQNTDQLTQPLDISYKLECPGFDRGRTDREMWKTYAWSVRQDNVHAIRIGLEECNYQQDVTVSADGKVTALPSTKEVYTDGIFQTEANSGSYTFPYSGSTEKTFQNQDDYLRYMGKYFCMDVRGTRGYIYQEQYVHHPGTYVIAARGYSNTQAARLFAGIVPTGTGKYDDLKSDATFGNMLDGSLRTTMLAQTANMDATEQERLHVAEKSMDYAGKEFYTSTKYINSVVVQVTSDMLPADGTGCRIRFGVMIGNPGENAVPDADEWTVFDEFRIYYASNSSKDEDLVLDELRGDLTYLQQATVYKNKTLHLAKTFVQNRWNSLVLPVALSSTQLRTAFGSNVRIAKLKRIEGTEIQFETVDLDKYSAQAMEAYVPYIIFPTRVMTEDGTSPYTAYVTKKGATELDMTVPIVVQKNHFDIAGVTMATNADGENDLSQVNDLWLPTLSYAIDDAKLTARGTFVRTFDADAAQQTDATADDYGQWTFSEQKGTIRKGYPDLTGCYFFDQGNMYYSDSQVRGLRGFSCWFEPAAKTQAAAQPTVYIDGIGQQGLLTRIGTPGAAATDAGRRAHRRGVYNLMGQRVADTTDGLPRGIYIVDGVKRMVK